MAKIKQITPARVLGASIPNPRVLGSKVEEIIEQLNSISNIDGSVEATNLTVSEQLTTEAAILESHTASAINVTATATAAQVITGYITSTSAAAVGITLPTATELATALGAAAGSSFEFLVDNSGGANTVTVIVGAGIVAATPVITGGGTLTVSVANGVGIFRLVFTSATAARLYRIG